MADRCRGFNATCRAVRQAPYRALARNPRLPRLAHPGGVGGDFPRRDWLDYPELPLCCVAPGNELIG